MVDILMGAIRRPSGRAEYSTSMATHAASPQGGCLHRDNLIPNLVLNRVTALQGASPPRP